MPARLHEILDAGLRPAVRIGTTSASDRRFKPGESRLGGHPDLPQGMAWPVHQGRPLSFIAQIALEDVRPLDVDHALPSQGQLFFFYDGLQQPWGFDPKDRGSWLVMHSMDAPLVRTEGPSELEDGGEYSPCALRFAFAWTLPDRSTLADRRIQLSDEESDAYDALIGELDQECGMEQVGHQLLGCAAPVQGEMELECQLASNGVYCGDARSDDPRIPSLTPGAADWRLLLQVDSDDDASMMWGDLGRIYFWIRRQDLEKADFSRVWTILQCS